MNPSLLLIPDRYKAAKLYSQIPDSGDGDLTFARNSNATRVNSAGLIEKVRTNLALYSEQFNDAAWTKYASTVTANTATAPDGTLTADTLADTATNDTHLAFQTLTTTAGEHTLSVHVKANTLSHAYILYFDAVTPIYSGIFNLSNGTVSGAGAITNAGNGWYRISLTFTATAASSNIYVGVSDGSSITYTGSGQSVFVWGAQLETGVLTPYIPTTTAAVSVGITADIPRLDYTGGGCPSLLLEPQRSNLVTFSEQFDNAAYNKSSAGSATTPVVTANFAISPDGFQNADRIQFARTGTTASDFSLINQGSLTLSAGGTATIYLKSNTLSNQDVLMYWGGGQGQVFSVTPEWQRFTLANLSAATDAMVIGTRGGSGSFFNGGDLTLDILAYGLQLEVGSYPTSYIPTLGSSVTRLADAASKTGISSLIGQTSGTLFYDGFYGNEINEVYLFLQKESSTTIEDSIYIQQSTGAIALNVYVGATQQVFIIGGSFAIGQRIKIAAAYSANDFVLYVNGTQIGTDNAGSVPTCGAMQLASYRETPTAANFIATKGINTAALYPVRLSNAELATLTAL